MFIEFDTASGAILLNVGPSMAEGRRRVRGRIGTSEGDVLSISIPRTEAHVIRHFQERMPYGLFVPDVAVE